MFILKLLLSTCYSYVRVRISSSAENFEAHVTRVDVTRTLQQLIAKDADYIGHNEVVSSARSCHGEHLTRHIFTFAGGLTFDGEILYGAKQCLGWGWTSRCMCNSFLGAGTLPEIPSWGNMMAEGCSYIQLGFWIVLFPGLSLAVTVLGINLLGDGLRDTAGPTAEEPDVRALHRTAVGRKIDVPM